MATALAKILGLVLDADDPAPAGLFLPVSGVFDAPLDDFFRAPAAGYLVVSTCRLYSMLSNSLALSATLLEIYRTDGGVVRGASKAAAFALAGGGEGFFDGLFLVDEEGAVLTGAGEAKADGIC